MDWIRKLLGYHIRPGAGDENPFRSPTWEEIVRKRDAHSTQDSQELQHPSEHFFHDGFLNDEMFSPHQHLFGQIDDMFSQLESLMQDMHHHPAWTLPDSLEDTDPQTPRDSLLKVPDTDPSVPPPAPSHPHYGHEGDQWGFQGGQEDFNQLTDPFPGSPFGLFDRIFQSFGLFPGGTPFPGHLPEFGSGPDSEDHSRESLMKKTDSDIDDRVSEDLSKLPEGGPGYSHESPQSPAPWWPHPESPASPHTGVRQKFYSQSIVTIRRPDGSVEETKKYRDSSGREEVTVTHKQPEDESH